MLFPQPEQMTISEPLEEVDDPCERCGASPRYRYRVADYRGWLRVTKCRTCLEISSSERIGSPALTGELS